MSDTPQRPLPMRVPHPELLAVQTRLARRTLQETKTQLMRGVSPEDLARMVGQLEAAVEGILVALDQRWGSM